MSGASAAPPAASSTSTARSTISDPAGSGLGLPVNGALRGVARVPVLRPLRILPALRPLVTAALLLALIAIQSPRSLWLNEAFAVRAARLPEAAYRAELRADDLGTAVSTALTRLMTGYSTYPEIIRVPGYVFAALTVLLLASTGRRLATLVLTNWRPPSVARPASIGVAAGLLAACHGMLGSAAATVGPGVVTVFCAALAVDLLIRVLNHGGWLTAVAAGLAGGLAIAVHLSSAAVVVAAFAALAVLPRRRLPVAKLTVAAVVTAGVGAVLVALTLTGSTARDQWAGTPGENSSLASAITLLGGGAGQITAQPGKALSRLATLALVLLVGLAVLHLARLLRVAGRGTATFVLAFPLALLAFPLVAAAVASAAGVEGAAGRSLVAAVPGVVLLAAVELYRSGGPSSAWLGIAEWRNGYSAAAAAATGALLGSLLVGVGGLSVLPCVSGSCAVEQWSVVVSRIETLRLPTDVAVVYVPETVLPYDYAATRVDNRLVAAGEAPLPHVVFPASVAAGLAASTSTDHATRVGQVGSAYGATGKAPRVWLVLSHTNSGRAEALIKTPGFIECGTTLGTSQCASLVQSLGPGAEDLDKALLKKYGHAFIWRYRGVVLVLFTHSALKPAAPED